MNKFEKIKSYLLKIISNSTIPEDLPHAENTLIWLLKIYPDAELFLKIAAIGHDIERAYPDRVRKGKFNNYDEFKKAHALRSAEILKKILLKFNLSNSIIKKVYNVVKDHEHGGEFYSDILKDADSLSFFDVNIKFFYEREGFENTLKRALWGYKRLSEKAKIYLKDIKYKEKELNLIIEKLIREDFYGN